MAAAVITATTVAKLDNPLNLVSGTTRRLKTLYLEGPLATTSDWFLLTTYLSAAEVTQIVGWRVTQKDSGNASSIAVIAYDSDDAKFVITASAGTIYAFIDYYEA